MRNPHTPQPPTAEKVPVEQKLIPAIARAGSADTVVGQEEAG
jgi:hypothetical protein